MKILPVTLEGPNGKIDTHSFLDSGSTVTLIKHDSSGRPTALKIDEQDDIRRQQFQTSLGESNR